MELYKFRNLKKDIEDGVSRDQEFEARTLIGALNLVSKAWFDGSEVIDYVQDNNQRVTLLSNHPQGNVIGRVYWW